MVQSKITVGGNSFLVMNYQNSQVIFINDLISEDGSFLSYDYIRNSLKVKTNFLEYTGLKKTTLKKSRVYPKLTNQTWFTLYSIYNFYFLQEQKML